MMNLKWILGYRKLMTPMLLVSMLLWTIPLATAQNNSEASVQAHYKDIQAIVYDKVRGIYGKDYSYDWLTNKFTTYSTTPTPLSQIDIRNNIVLDGELNEDAWNGINPVTINLEPTHPWGGAIKRVSVRALNNGTWLFLALQWEDSTESREEMPRIKRPEGGFFYNSTYFYSDNLVIGWWMKEGKPTVKPWFSVHYAGSTMGLVPWKDDPTAKASLWIYKAYFVDDDSKHWPQNYISALRTFKWGRFVGQPNVAPYPHLVETLLNATANYAVSMATHITGCAFPGEDMYSWDVRGNGKWRDGVWTLEVARPFEPHPLNQRFNATMRLESGKIYYFFLAAGDGHHGENNEVGSISGWFTLYIEPPPSPIPIINWPLGSLVAAATGVIGIIAAWLVWRRSVRKKIALGKAP